jgi:DNA-binding Xre family transcriptional regulator
MDAHGMTAATDLLPPLAARGVRLSPVAAWRLVTQSPTRLSLPVLAALCDIFDCAPNDLITTYGTRPH